MRKINIEKDETAEAIVHRSKPRQAQGPTLKVGDRYFALQPVKTPSSLAAQLKHPPES